MKEKIYPFKVCGNETNFMIEAAIASTQSLFDDTLTNLNNYLTEQLEKEVTDPYNDHIGIVTPKIDDIKRWVVEEPVDRAEGDTDIQKLLDSWEAGREDNNTETWGDLSRKRSKRF